MAPTQQISIKRTAELMGVSVDTLRYYERIGLLPRVRRTASGRRGYTDVDLSWIDFLLQCKKSGMSIEDMQEVSKLHQAQTTTPAEIRYLFEAHRTRIQARLHELERHLHIVQHKVEFYQALEAQQAAIPRPDDDDKVSAQREKLDGQLS
ncbi:MAG: MerR family transcriptional regulator [Armatimonadetes bacterium]|nr:MerR family transcriptional regulator [Anaerolineae bacterium]